MPRLLTREVPPLFRRSVKKKAPPKRGLFNGWLYGVTPATDNNGEVFKPGTAGDRAR